MTILATARLGPRHQGRSYGVLRHSLAPHDFDALGPILEDFSMALAAWADLAASDFAAMFRLDADGRAFALGRGRYFGRAALGTVAVANLAIIPAAVMESLDWRSHDLLGLLPTPGEDDFGASGVALPSGAGVRPARTAAAFGLEWRDHVIDASGTNREALLKLALDSVKPPVQMARIDGWATTGALQASGAFDPDRAFRLVVREAGETRGADFPGRTVLQAANGQLAIPKTLSGPPPAWRAVAMINSVTRTFSDAAPTEWRPAMAQTALDGLVSELLLHGAGGLAPADGAALIGRAVASARPDDELDSAFRAGATDALERWIPDSPSIKVTAARLEQALLDNGLRDAGVSARLVGTIPLDDVLPLLGIGGFDAALESGLAARVAAEQDPALLEDLAPEALAGLLEHSLADVEENPRARDLARRLIRAVALAPRPKARLVTDGLSRLLGATSGPMDDSVLAIPAVAAAATRLNAKQRADYAVRVLRPVLDGERGRTRTETIHALAAAALMLEAGS